jgi:hypothetical protein
VATITGITTTSMIAVELIRRSRSADAIGPCGSRTPPEQPARKGTSIRTPAILGDGVRRFEGRKTIDQYIDDEPASVAVPDRSRQLRNAISAKFVPIVPRIDEVADIDP